MRKSPFALLALALLTQPAQADIYKCRLANGSLEFSNSPCGGNSSTLKSINAEVIPEESRREAERKVERMRDEADKLETRRRAEEAAERQEQEKESQRLPSGPSASQIQTCLETLARLSLDSARRTELEASCHANGVVQPVYVPVPYYVGPSYVRPRHAQPLPTPHKPETKPQTKPQTRPEPLHQPQPTKPASKTNSAYTPPSGFKPR